MCLRWTIEGRRERKGRIAKISSKILHTKWADRQLNKKYRLLIFYKQLKGMQFYVRRHVRRWKTISTIANGIRCLKFLLFFVWPRAIWLICMWRESIVYISSLEIYLRRQISSKSVVFAFDISSFKIFYLIVLNLRNLYQLSCGPNKIEIHQNMPGMVMCNLVDRLIRNQFPRMGGFLSVE